MKDFKIQVDQNDLKRFERKMRLLKIFANKDFYDSFKNAGVNAVKIAQRRVPVKTGDLKRSIHVGGDKKNIYVAAEMDYAGYVEFGTSYQSPQPYFFNSIREALAIMVMDIKHKIVKIEKL